MNRVLLRFSYILFMCFSLLILSACGGSSSSNSSAKPVKDAELPSDNTPPEEKFSTGRTFIIAPTPNATQEMVDAMIQLKPGDTLEFSVVFLS